MVTLVTEHDAIASTFAEVAEQSFFAFAEPGAADPEALISCAEWISASVRFAGPFDGRMTVTVPTALGYELCGSFLGYGPEDPLEASNIDDMVGELANMTCGAWLTQTQSAHTFALTHPEVTRSGQAPGEPSLWMSCNGQPVAVQLEMESQAQ